MRLGQNVPASQLFWIVEQDAVVEWVYYAGFHQLYSPTYQWIGTTKSNSNELPISVPLLLFVFLCF